MSTATLPEPGSTTPITYTGDDGKSFTFNVKWPDSFTEVVDYRGAADNYSDWLDDSRHQVDLNNFDPDDYYTYTDKKDDGTTETVKSNTFGTMKSAMETILKGLNTWWLREGAKLDYDTLGLGLDGQTIEIKFMMGDPVEWSSAITFGRRGDNLPSNFMSLGININLYGNMNANDPNGAAYNSKGDLEIYLDRVIAHELVHATMYATGTDKEGMPQIFTEGIAEAVQGIDDYNAGRRNNLIKLVNDSDTAKSALNYETGTGAEYAYAAGPMLMCFLAHQNLNTTAIVGDPNQAQTFDYNGNNEVITNYVEADTINYNASFKSADISKTFNDFLVTTNDDNELIIRDVRGKLMTFNAAGTNVYAYMSPDAGEINGNNFNGGNNYEVIFGANYENNVLRAGNAGSYLWGGNRGNDELFGGAGADTFIYVSDGGKDTIHNAESQDSVTLWNIELAQISSAQFTDNGLIAQFTDGGTLTIEGQPSTFTLDKDDKVTTYRADYQNKTFTQA